MRKETLLLIEDQELFGSSIQQELRRAYPKARVLWGRTGEEGLRYFEKYKPDLILLDIELPGMSGHEVLEKMQEKNPRCHILIMTSYINQVTLYRLRSRGIMGIIDKNELALEHMHQAIKEIRAGRYYRSSQMERICRQINVHERAIHKVLTPREQGLMRYFGLGYSNQEIGETVGLSPSTVQGHRRNVMCKLELGSSRELICASLIMGFVSQLEIERERAEEMSLSLRTESLVRK